MKHTVCSLCDYPETLTPRWAECVNLLPKAEQAFSWVSEPGPDTIKKGYHIAHWDPDFRHLDTCLALHQTKRFIAYVLFSSPGRYRRR